MRAYTFALYNLLLNIILGVMTFMPLFGVGMPGVVLWSGNGTGTYQFVHNETYNFTASNQSVVVLPYDPNLTEQSNISTYRPGGMADFDIFGAIMTVVTQFWKLTAFTGWLLYNLGFHPNVYIALTTGQYFVYGFGIIQFFLNRPEKEYA